MAEMYVMLWEEGKARSSQEAWGHKYSGTMTQGHRRAQHILFKGVILVKELMSLPHPEWYTLQIICPLSHWPGQVLMESQVEAVYLQY